MKRTLKDARTLLTGASSGIGRALAVELAKAGARLVVTARRAERLNALAEEIRRDCGTEIHVVPGDITTPQTREELIQKVLDEFHGLEVLVNNAGAGATELVEAVPEQTARNLFELNYFAPLLLTQKAVPLLRKAAWTPERWDRKIRPIVVNIGSIVGLRGTPHYGVYGSAKAALICLADALRAENASDGIDFLTVSPGTTSSEFFDVLLENQSMPKFPKHGKATPEHVARKIVQAMKKGKHRIIPHGGSRILDRLHRFVPGTTDGIMASFK